MIDNIELRKLQLMEAAALIDITNFCEENNITYYLSDGTLLGAVRHQGFIPWDDDIDITMPYADYKRFLKIAPNQLGEKYYVQSSFTDSTFYCAYSKVRINNTTMMKRMHRFSKTHQGIWIDIFPIIEFNDGIELKIKKTIITICNFLMIDDHLRGCEDDFKKLLKWRYPLLVLLCKIPIRIRQRIQNSIMDWLGASKKKARESYVWGNITHHHRKGVLTGLPEKVLFEGRYYNTYPKYHEYLKDTYGDFMQMPPVEKRRNHLSDFIIDMDKDYTFYIENL